MAEAAQEAAEEIDPKRIEVLAGDISERRLGLADDDWDRLVKDVRRVYHLAAIYDLAVPVEAAQRVNVDGTGNVLELCAAAKKLERLAYVSTAYVAGQAPRRGLRARAGDGPGVQEPLRVDQVPGRGVGARGDGERAHHDPAPGDRGRRLAHRRDPEVRRALLHPARHLGDRAGRPADDPVRPRRRPVQRGAGGLRGRGDRHGRRACRRPRGRRFHLVDPEPLTSAELVRALAREYGAREPKGRMPPRLVEAAHADPGGRASASATPRGSRSPTSTTRWSSTRAARSTCSAHTG